MERDGKNKSLWQMEPSPYQPLNSGGWDRDKIYDVLIVGGGVTGLTTGVLLQRAGYKCVLAEAHTIGFGTSLGTTSHLNTLLDTTYADIENDFGKDAAQLVAKGSANAIDLIEELSAKAAIDCGFSRQKAWLVAATSEEEQQLEEVYEAFVRTGLTAYADENCPVRIPAIKSYCFEGQGQVNAGSYIWALAEMFEELGGIILEHCLVDEILQEGGIQVAKIIEGDIKTVRVVYATHIPPGVNQYSLLCAPYRSYAMAFTLADGAYPEGLVYDLKDPYNYFRSQTIKDQQYVIAGGFDHKTGHCENTEFMFKELEALVRRYFNIEEISYKWSSQYYEPVDGLPYMGRYPGRDETFLSTGYSGNGYTLGTLSAIITSDLIIKGHSEYEEIFSPSRLKPLASAKNFVTENADVLKEWFKGFLKGGKLRILADLAPDEARIVQWEGNSVAFYKSEAGKIYAVDAVCPHMGCKVDWNNTEKTWDCPCHGSRFSYDGSLLTGPALSGLKGYDIDNYAAD